MTFFDVFAWVVMLLLVATSVAVVVLLGRWPAKVARARNHPQAEAIAIGSWLTLFLGFVLWPLVVIWAYVKPAHGGAGAPGNGLEQKFDAPAGRHLVGGAACADRRGDRPDYDRLPAGIHGNTGSLVALRTADQKCHRAGGPDGFGDQ